MKILAYILTFLLFIGPVVLAVIGLPVEGDMKVIYLYPSFYVLILVMFASFFKGKLAKPNYKWAIRIVIVVFSWFLVNKLLGRSNSKMILFNSMALPAMYYMFYEILKDSRFARNEIRNLMLFLFVFNCLMAIYERLTMTLFFPFDLIRTENEFNFTMIQDMMKFRSSALLGHPLTNALFMSIIMIFILTSKIRPFFKYSLYVLGFFSLFCFNTRAAIILSAGTFVLYAIHPLFQKDVPLYRRLLAIGMLLLFIAFGAYLLSAGYGGRFEERGDFDTDSSVMARIDVWDIFAQYGITNFLWGMSGKDVDSVAASVLGATHIENWFILSTMVVGLVITLIVTFSFIPLYRNAQRSFDRYSSFLIFIMVIGLSSTNNSLACGVQALSLYFACCFAFAQQGTVMNADTHAHLSRNRG